MTTAEITAKYQAAAKIAFDDGIDAGNEPQLIEWIRKNCKYDAKNEFFLVLGIGCELANLQSQKRGFKSNVHEAYELAQKKIKNTEIKVGDRVKHSYWAEEKFMINEYGKFSPDQRHQAYNSFMAEEGEVINSFNFDDLNYLEIKWDNGLITTCRASMAEFTEKQSA